MKNEYRQRGFDVVINLTCQKGPGYTLISASDFDLVNSFPGTWSLTHRPKPDTYYVCGQHTDENGRKKKVMLHKWIMNPPDGYVVDHINGNTVDNMRSNLRVCTKSENAMNRKYTHPKHDVSGVSYSAKSNKYRATVSIRGKQYYLGQFDNLEEAQRVIIDYQREYRPRQLLSQSY